MRIALFHSYTNRKHVLFQKSNTNTFSMPYYIGIKRKLQRQGICLLLLSTIIISQNIQAQWQMVAPSLLGKQDIVMSSIVHKAGLTWAGTKALFMSPDSGISWMKRWNIAMGKDLIVDITFYDNNIGLVCTLDGYLYRTDDQGINWRQLQGFSTANTAAFLGSSNDIIITSDAKTVSISRDGGNTWISKVLDDYVEQVKPLLGGSAMVFAGNYTTKQGNIYKTTDYGMTWQQLTGKIDLDSYSFDVDPCNPNYIYAVNEEGTTLTDNKGSLFISTDGGNSFNLSMVSPIRYFSGSIARTTKAVFIQTVSNGISRSTDQGTTWKPIGGPSVTYDTRLLCAINSNIVLAADDNGSIWRTINSGGDSILNISAFENLAITPLDLFTLDTLVSCDSPIVATVHLHSVLCKYPKISAQRISGIDSLDYQIVQKLGDSLTGNDSVLISFRPHGSGSQNGVYIITLEDGTQVSVSLKGNGRNIIFVEPNTQNITLDTIGGFAEVPIRFKGFLQKEDVEVVLHYDPRMTYNSSISFTGKPLDIPGEAWQGRAKIRIPRNEMELDTISGIAIFTVFPDGNDCFNVTVDSMSILNPFAPCTYSIGSPVASLICPPKGCGIMTLTNYMLHGKKPELYIKPNPSQGRVSITTTITIGDAAVEVVDMLGRNYLKKNIFLKKEIPVQLQFDDLRTGSYYLRINSNGLLYQLPLAIIR